MKNFINFSRNNKSIIIMLLIPIIPISWFFWETQIKVFHKEVNLGKSTSCSFWHIYKIRELRESFSYNGVLFENIIYKSKDIYFAENKKIEKIIGEGNYCVTYLRVKSAFGITYKKYITEITMGSNK